MHALQTQDIPLRKIMTPKICYKLLLKHFQIFFVKFTDFHTDFHGGFSGKSMVLHIRK